MRERLAEVLIVSALAAAAAAVIGAPVLHAPSQRVFGMELVGRHHDPFTVMAQFDRPISVGMYSQPVTDIAGSLLARLAGPVAAYNWLVLVSFPLAAAASYLLARHLALSPAASAFAALAYAFSPFHLAHAAYHPHIAQTQWIPLYLLALWRCIDAATPGAVAFLGIATLGVTLSNFYGGLIAAVVTPVAVAAYWLVMRPGYRQPMRGLTITVFSLAAFAACGIAYVSYFARAVVAGRDAFAFPRSDLSLYSAHWWSYLVPPVAHPVLGTAAHRFWTSAGVREGLLEQQVTLGCGLLVLAAIAVYYWLRFIRNRHSACGARLPVLVAVAAAALACSLAPERLIAGHVVEGPSALLYAAAPMFRAYARFGVVVHLMAAMIAAIGIDFLRRTGTRNAQIACGTFIALVATEYAVAPSALSRDVLPTVAHRWVMEQPGRVLTFDCAPHTPDSDSIRWLTRGRVTAPASSTSDCTEPNLPDKLAAGGYEQLLVRRDSADGRWFAARPAPHGLRVAAAFDDAVVFAVTAPVPEIYTAAMTGFFPREHDADWSWQWMAGGASWTIVNTAGRPVMAAVNLELSAFHRARRMELTLDGQPAQTIAIDPSRRVYRIGPLQVASGSHELVFRPEEPPSVANALVQNGDTRPLSFAVGAWNWSVPGAQP